MSIYKEPIFDLKTNKKDKEWYESIINYVVPYDTTTVSDYQKMKQVYGILNNDITIIKDELDRLCKPLGDLFDFTGAIDDELVVYNRIFPKYMYMIGEMLKRGDTYDVMVMSGDAHKLKTQELREVFEQSIDEKIKILMEQVNLEAQGADPQQLQEYYNQMRSQVEPEDIDIKEYRGEIEQFYSKVLDYFTWKFNLKRLKSMSFKHVLAADRCFIGIIDKNGIPTPFVENPLHVGFHKSPDLERVEEGDWFWNKTAITISQAYDELSHKVSTEEIEKLSTYTGLSNLRPNEAWDIKSGAYSQYNYSNVEAHREGTDVFEKHVGQAMGSGTNRRYNTERLIWKTYMQFKAYREVIILTYTDEFGEEVSEFVPNNYEIPKEATLVRFKDRYGRDSKRHEWVDLFGNSVYAEKIWIPRRYECTRYGSELIVDYREVPNQPLSIDNPFEFELGIKGRIFTNLNSEPISLVERAVPSMMQYTFVKNLQNKELAKYEGYIKNIDASQIPDYLAQDENGDPLYEGVDKIAIWRYFRRKLGESFFDPNLSSTGALVNNQKTTPVKPEVAGSFAEIINMQNLLELIDREIGIQMLVPPQAEGLFEPHSNVRDNQQALDQGYTMAEEYYHLHNEVWRNVLNEYVLQFRNYYKRFFEENPEVTETSLHYITAEGTKELMKITPDLLDFEEIGVFLTDTTYSESYRRFMTSQLQAISQNAGEGVETVSQLVMSLTRGDSPEKIHKMIVLASKKQQQRIQQMEEMKQETLLRREQLEFRKQDQKHAHKLEEIDVTKAHDKEIKAIDIFKFAQDKDQDQDEIPDYIEAARAVHAMNAKDRELNLKEKELEIKRKQVNKNSKT